MRKMSPVYNTKIISENNYSLPPSVTGKLHGFCELFIENLKWTTTKTYSTVNLAVKFWGENKARIFEKVEIKSFDRAEKRFGKTIKTSSKSLLAITYKVCTNHRLFQAYLKSCEPITIDIYSSKTSDFIGKSFIEIPQELRNLEHKSSCKTVVDIQSGRNFKLGEITITFEVKLNINCGTMLIKPISLKTKPEKDECINKCQKSIKTSKSRVAVAKRDNRQDENKENLEIIGKSKIISFRHPMKQNKKQSFDKTKVNPKNLLKQKSTTHNGSSSNKSTTTSLVSENGFTTENYLKHNMPNGIGELSLINYLSGIPMTNSDESRVLSDLMQLSPSQSLIDGIKINNSKVNNAENQKCLKVLINILELNEIGYGDVRNYFNNFSDAKFIFKCALTSKLFKNRENLNFISSVLEYPSHRIVFCKELRKNINLPENPHLMYLNFGFCLKTIEWKYSSSHLIGFCRLNLAEIIRSKSAFFKKCPVLNENDIRVGFITLRIEMTDDSNLIATDHPECPSLNHILSCEQKLKVTSHPSTSNNDLGDINFEHKNMQTGDNEQRSKGLSRKDVNSSDNHHNADMIEDCETMKNSSRKMRVYQGILFIEGLRSVKEQQSSTVEYFMTYEGFWNECQEITNTSVHNVFNYLKQFPVIFDIEFLRKVQNNYMELKLWEKNNENSEKFIASTRVPLHQFYIAFKDAEMIDHLTTNKLPVISTDTWCNFVSPISNELYCQGKILLAIGSENQIDFLKLSRNLHNIQKPQSIIDSNNKGENESSRINNLNYDPNAQIKSKLTAFIESLSQKLPEPSAANLIQQKFSTTPVSSNSSIELAPHLSQRPQLRRTSDLLDSLQKALSQPPSVDSFSLLQQTVTTINSALLNDCIKMNVVIEHASNLPKVNIKKCRSNKRKNKGSTLQQKSEFAPYTYATFEATTDHLNENSLPPNAIKSHEGIVYCTNVIKSINPEWNTSFDVFIPFDILKNTQKKFVIKVWRKTSHEPTNIEPKPFEDTVIGFSAIDLSVLLTGLPILSGYYSLVDFSGRSNGQIKVSLKPLDDVNKFRNPSSPLVPLMQPLNIDVSSSESSNDGSTLLSRTLKRKFTELDEITQRLRARLFDVTGDENIDPDEEFERDLNTVVDDEMDVNDKHKEDFGWLKKENDENGGCGLIQQAKGFQDEFNKLIDSRPSTSKAQSSCIPTQRDITGCSSETSQLAMDDLLKKYDLDTLINPNIFKNILDPTLANSDSTPTLNARPANENVMDNQDESDVTTISSIISNDQVQMIQKALQKTYLHEEKKNSPRREPDGNVN